VFVRPVKLYLSAGSTGSGITGRANLVSVSIIPALRLLNCRKNSPIVCLTYRIFFENSSGSVCSPVCKTFIDWFEESIVSFRVASILLTERKTERSKFLIDNCVAAPLKNYSHLSMYTVWFHPPVRYPCVVRESPLLIPVLIFVPCPKRAE